MVATDILTRIALDAWQVQNLSSSGSGGPSVPVPDFAKMLLLAYTQPGGGFSINHFPIAGLESTPFGQTGQAFPAQGTRSPQSVASGRNGERAMAEGKKGLVELADRTARKYGVSPKLVRSVINAESGFDPHAVSSAGAEGLMQLMPKTARSLGVANPMNPAQNVDGGVRYLKQMLERYHGNVPLALAAYNAGPGAVDRAGGIPDFKETQAYVREIMRSNRDQMV